MVNDDPGRDDLVPDEFRAGRAHRRPPITMRVTETIARRMDRSRPSRRSVLTTTAVAGSALALAPWRFLTRPVSAYDSVCGPASDCASGWTVFCCTVNEGRNQCPPDTVAAGWWKADANNFCSGGPRYYVDCNSTCGTCGCGSNGICGPECWPCSCRCHDDPNTCDHRRHCCNRFRYGNCNAELPCVGPVVCRVVSCVPPWEWEPSCTTVSATNDRTGAHTAPCLGSTKQHLFAFGDARDLGEGRGRLGVEAAGVAMRPDGEGGWVVGVNGALRTFGAARNLGSLVAEPPGHPIVDICATPTGRGYWMVNAKGRLWSFGDAVRFGSTAKLDLVKPIVAMACTPAGDGYWLVNSNGRVFAFGAAQHHDPPAPVDLPSKIVGIAPSPTGLGYWLVAQSGLVFAFGDAVHRGSASGLDSPVVGMAAVPDGRGYFLVTRTGRVARFGSAAHRGGLGAVRSPHGPAYAIRATATGDGYWIAAQPG